MTSHETQELLAFVRQLPVGMAYAPIYAKGRALQSGKISKGKTPLEKSHHVVMTPADVALQIERKPEVFQAVDRKSTRLNSSHVSESRMPSSA